ncbi:glutathione S-transferase, putative [Bodo saltans]|uniref:Glutathione peroxidase n=1 Tax=Bodo saltans TaxID=75058 RepID=A0A0S4IL19_BODSA|nr:glutathione S-transferase, putative [Bodo saltans]|eukprot:CUF18931.1 glutathione S-transferase, putative [Bodo saltans]
MSCCRTSDVKSVKTTDAQAPSIYDFEVLGSDKKPYDLKQHKGKPLVIYNVASKCGYTDGGYKTAQELYSKYKDQGFTVLAFPCNQFASQEPGTEEEIKEFACKKFSAEFPIMAKVDVNGDKASPLYEYLKTKVPGILGTTSVKWNFTSFLVDENGVAIERYSPGAKAEEIEKKLVPLLERTAAL